MVPTPARCLAMAVTATGLAVTLLVAGAPGAVLLAFTPGILCLAMYFAPGDNGPRDARTAARRHDQPLRSAVRPPRHLAR